MFTKLFHKNFFSAATKFVYQFFTCSTSHLLKFPLAQIPTCSTSHLLNFPPCSTSNLLNFPPCSTSHLAQLPSCSTSHLLNFPPCSTSTCSTSQCLRAMPKRNRFFYLTSSLRDGDEMGRPFSPILPPCIVILSPTELHCRCCLDIRAFLAITRSST